MGLVPHMMLVLEPQGELAELEPQLDAAHGFMKVAEPVFSPTGRNQKGFNRLLLLCNGRRHKLLQYEWAKGVSIVYKVPPAGKRQGEKFAINCNFSVRLMSSWDSFPASSVTRATSVY